ncbi:MAG TPA: hypothetical protein VLI04_01520 [Nocardioidaceae bacterium]|nr:hypothetical protein [Nocardioidaceae bacterium]
MPTRRTVLTAAVMAGALAACTAEGAGSDTVPTSTPDFVATKRALAAAAAAVELIDKVTLGHSQRKRALAQTRSIHVAHLELLTLPLAEGSVTSEPHLSPGPPFRGDDRAAYLAVAKEEDLCGQTLRRIAFQAESGQLARVFAGMAAATAQQSVVLRGLL